MDKIIPVHRETMNTPGRKDTTRLDKPGSLMFYCPGCNSKFKKMPGYAACPTCEGSVLAINKDSGR